MKYLILFFPPKLFSSPSFLELINVFNISRVECSIPKNIFSTDLLDYIIQQSCLGHYGHLCEGIRGGFLGDWIRI